MGASRGEARHGANPTKTRAVALIALLVAAGCSRSGDAAKGRRKLVVAAYTTPREAYEQSIFPAFAKHWKERTGEAVTLEGSFLASGAQARAIVAGFEADVAALSLAPDLQVLDDAGLIVRNWRQGPRGGIVSRSIVVLAVRRGNPKQIADWDDLRRSDVDVITPDVKTSGGAMWNIAAIYGAALRGGTKSRLGDPAAAQGFLADVLARVAQMAPGSRETMVAFEGGAGDVAITYEHEALASARSGHAIEYVVPRATLLVENPATVVDAYARKHGAIDLAEAFVEFLYGSQAQHAFVTHGFRPLGEPPPGAPPLPAVPEPFTIRDLGGWDLVVQNLFDANGVYDRARSRPPAAR